MTKNNNKLETDIKIMEKQLFPYKIEECKNKATDRIEYHDLLFDALYIRSLCQEYEDQERRGESPRIEDLQ